MLPTVLEPFVAAPSRAALLVDYDGSLAPIVDDPAAAVILPAARDALARLVPLLGRVAVVSGRPVDYLRDHVSVPGVSCVGQYGLERDVDGESVSDPRAERYVDDVARLATAASTEIPGVYVERKGRIALGLHWRRRPGVMRAVEEWADAAARATGLELARGRMAVELRPPVPVDKGTVVEELARETDAIAFAGDDRGDLPAFAALDRLHTEGRLTAIAKIAVRSPEEPPEIVARADTHVDGPTGLAVLLDALAASIRPGPG